MGRAYIWLILWLIYWGWRGMERGRRGKERNGKGVGKGEGVGGDQSSGSVGLAWFWLGLVWFGLVNTLSRFSQGRQAISSNLNVYVFLPSERGVLTWCFALSLCGIGMVGGGLWVVCCRGGRGGRGVPR
jgi:hypothetical protein